MMHGGRRARSCLPLPACLPLTRRLDPWFLALLAGLGLLPFVPFAVPIVAALALAAASLPLQVRLEARMPAWLAASVVTLGWTLLAALPMVALAALLAPALPRLAQTRLDVDALTQAALHAPWVGPLLTSHEAAVRSWIAQNQPSLLLQQHVAEIRLVGEHVLALLVHALLALALLWAVLWQRAHVAHALRSSLGRIVSPALAESVERHTLQATQATIVGSVGLAAWDTLLSLPLFALAGMPRWYAWSIAVGLLSVIPGGTGVALVFAAALLGAQGHLLPGLAVLALGHVITLSGDVLVKPKLIGAAGHAPFLLVLLAIFGGLSMFGMVGLILGPVLVITARAVVFED